jgi:tetratricopeptide (TPR) repeat protein
MTPAFAEKETYKLYTEKNWNDLIEFGEDAIKNGNDYYYLRMRIGIAYYENKNYNLAKKHFTKALEHNSKSELTNEYLYYCYFFTGKYEEARKLSKTFSKHLLIKLKLYKASKIEFINAEIALKSADKNYADTFGVNYFETASYFQIGMKHYIKNNFSLFHAGTIFKQKTNVGAVKQLQYYLQAAIPLKNNWLLSPAFHIVNTKFTGNSFNTDLTANSTNFVGSLSIKKSVNKFDFSIGSTYSNIRKIKQYNHFGTIAYTPFGNSKLVIGTTEYFHTSNDYTTTNISHVPFIYFQPTKLTSIKLSYLKNETDNIIEDNGYLVNNSYDLTKSRMSTLVNLKISKQTYLYGMYQYEQKQYKIDSVDFDYNYNLFLVGIKVYH